MAALMPLDAIAERVAAGAALTPEDAEGVLAAHDLIAIGMMGDSVRRQVHGARTTFGRVFEVHADAVPAALPREIEVGEVRLVGKPASVEAARSAVEAAKRLAGDVPLTGFSLADLLVLAREGDPYGSLAAAGLQAIAELPLDLVEDIPAAVAPARAAGLRTPRLTVQHPASDPITLFGRAVRAQEVAGGFHALAPLPRHVPADTPTTGYDDVKMVALARLLVRNIPSIQVDWPLYGPKLAQVALTVGADDVDGVAGVDAEALGHRRSALEEIRRNIRAAGFEPIERNGCYEVVERPAGTPGRTAGTAH